MAIKEVKHMAKSATTTASALSSTVLTAHEVKIKNLSAEVAYVGAFGVAHSDGYALAQNAEISLGAGEMVQGELDLNKIFVITQANTADLRIIYTKSA